MKEESEYIQNMINKWGREKTQEILKSRASKGGKSGSNGLQKLTKEQRSEIGKRNMKKLKADNPEKVKEWGRQGADRRWLDSLSQPQVKDLGDY